MNSTALPRANETTKYDENATPQDVGVESQQLAMGPVLAPKQKPTIAKFRDACDAFNIRGTCRLLGYELLTYWRPGGAVFPSVATLAAGLGLSPRTVQRHMARLERLGLWLRLARVGSTNLYELRLPGPVTVVSGGGDTHVTPRVTPTSPRSKQREVTTKVQAAAVLPASDKQQQQRRRIEGLIAACAARARTLKRPYDEADERQRLAAREINVDNLQDLADDLSQQIDAQQSRRRRR